MDETTDEGAKLNIGAFTSSRWKAAQKKILSNSPLPDDTDATGERFMQLDEALQPAFLSREEASEGKRAMLSYFSTGNEHHCAKLRACIAETSSKPRCWR